MDTVSDCRELLDQAGWAVTESHSLAGTGPEWVVMGTNGSHVIEARGARHLDAWLEAVEQARALGMVN